MSKTKKKSILIIGVVVLAILSFIIFLVFSEFKTEKSIPLKDSQGEIFAYVEWDGVSENFVSEDEYAKTYACTVFNEALKIIEEQQENVGEDKELVRYVFFKLVAGEFVNLGSFTLRLLDTWLMIKTWLKHF